MSPSIEWSDLITTQQSQIQQHPVFNAISKVLSLMGSVSPALSGKWLNSLWFKPQSMPLKEEDKSWLNTANTEWMTFNDKEIPIYRWGEGAAILCVHGWGGHSGQFTPMIKALVKKGFQVIAFDAPAHGAATGKRTDLTEFSGIIECIIQKEKSPVHIIAHSMGGVASVDVINRGFPALSLTLMGTPLSLEYIVKVTQVQMALGSNIMNAHKRLMETKFGRGVWQRFDLLKSNKELATPLMLVYDKDDTQIVFEVSGSLQRHWAHARSIITEGLGHNRLLRDEKTISGVLDFLHHST
ncbi:hypothetical protein A9Q81_10425 [Gammaproteobacteria bacterium 42_54_T18]|nr:hypothetical protein A9Q81_10425 [Gammaproteobacteria bacterium 42_54_T18]